MNLAEHPTVRHFHETRRQANSRHPLLSMPPGCVNCASIAGPTTLGLVEIGRPGSGRPARRHPAVLSRRRRRCSASSAA